MSAQSAPAAHRDDEWTALKKIVFRFVFCYCALYFIFIWSDYLTAVPTMCRPWRVLLFFKRTTTLGWAARYSPKAKAELR